jgi:hypothetical protein
MASRVSDPTIKRAARFDKVGKVSSTRGLAADGATASEASRQARSETSALALILQLLPGDLLVLVSYFSFYFHAATGSH